MTARRRLATVAVLVAILVPLMPGEPGATEASPSLSITHSRQSAHWRGHFRSSNAGLSTPEACVAVDCDEITVSVDLPSVRWSPGGGLQVGLRWADEEQDLDLFVYGPDGALAAKSDGVLASTSESVVIPSPDNGDYRIVVVPRVTEDLPYEGLAQIEQGTRLNPVRDLQPDLIALPPRNASFSTGSYYLSNPSASPTGCYPEEMVEDGARRCLRFDQILGNVGSGPFELRYDLTTLGTDQQLRQRVYRSDSSWWEREAGRYEFHPTHAHFHYRNFSVSRLWASDDQGRRLGDAPVKTGQKNGFCVIDVENFWFGRQGDAPRTYSFPQCLASSPDDGEPTLQQGMSVGWADVYNWFLPDQYIEVSGVPDGYYLLETTADADGLVLEEDEDNNTVAALIRICGDAAEIVGRQQACPQPASIERSSAWNRS